jgi:hypothetical protein
MRMDAVKINRSGVYYLINTWANTPGPTRTKFLLRESARESGGRPDFSFAPAAVHFCASAQAHHNTGAWPCKSPTARGRFK